MSIPEEDKKELAAAGFEWIDHDEIATPAKHVSWDWNEQQSFSKINALLKPFGCRIEELETNSDQYEVRVIPLKP